MQFSSNAEMQQLFPATPHHSSLKSGAADDDLAEVRSAGEIVVGRPGIPEMIEEHASVVLTEPLPSAGLEAGDVGVVVHVHRDGKAFEVEFMTLDGNTLTVETLTAKQIRAARDRDIPHVRERTIPA